MSEGTFKTPFIKDMVRIYPITVMGNTEGSSSAPLGQISYKMQLRKPVQETLRFFRERAEVANMSRAISLG